MRFYEDNEDGTLNWEANAAFGPNDVHRQVRQWTFLAGKQPDEQYNLLVWFFASVRYCVQDAAVLEPEHYAACKGLGSAQTAFRWRNQRL